jgi:nitrogen fixation protein NifQ
MRENFPALAAKNSGDMKWKKFFYRQLCERAQVPVCKAPHCAECSDYTYCFSHDS